MKVVFFPGASGIDAAGCYRAIFPMGYLAARGHQASMPSMMLHDMAGNPVRPLPGPGVLNRVPGGNLNVSFLDDFPKDADLYVFHGGTASWQLEWAEKLDGRIVLDVDDDIHRVPSWNPGKSTPEGRRNVRRMAEMAALVTCATPALAEFYSRFNRNVVVLRNRLHWPMWGDLPPVWAHKSWRRFRVGYMGNMAFHRADLELIAAPLRKWLLAHPEVEFVAAGDPRIHDVVGTPWEQRVSTSQVWFRNLDLPYVTSCFDVGLVPLVKCDFNECKSWLKGMEYAACGIPCLASPTGEYKEWLSEAGGYTCQHPRDFIERLDALAGDPDLVRSLGESAHRAARASSLDQHIEEWEAA